MSLKKKIIKGSFVVGAGEALNYACSFGRNMILARILAKSDFGIAATFAMVMAILEFSGKLAVARFVVQDKDGDRPEFIATAHFVQFAASVLSTISMLLAAIPIAKLFGIEGHENAFLLLAFFPLLKGLEHLDTARMERELHFLPSSICALAPQVLITIAAWPLARGLPDYRAVLLLLAIKGVGTTVMTHILAERPYRWAVNKVYAAGMIRFGWPLLLNGFLMFGVFQGDQFLVGHYYSMTDLGTYAAAATLATAPMFIFARILSSVMLPLMAQVQNNVDEFRKRYRLCIQIVSAFSACYAAATILGADSLMNLAYGKKYAGTGIILAWLAASNAFRIIRVAPAIAALAKADSQNQMKSNLLRIVALLPALWCAIQGQPIWVIAAMGVLGEALACLYSFWRLTVRDGISWSSSLTATSWTALAICLAGTIGPLLGTRGTLWSLPLAVLLGGSFGLATLVALPESRRQFFISLKQFRSILTGLKEKAPVTDS